MNKLNDTKKDLRASYVRLEKRKRKLFFLFLLISLLPQAAFSNKHSMGNPHIRAVKSVLKTENLPDGNIAILYKIGIKNTGTSDLSNLEVNFDVASQIGNAYLGISDIPSALNVFSSTATVSPQVNPNFDGSSNINLLDESITDLLLPNEEVFVLLSVDVNPYELTWPLVTQLTARAEGLNPLGNLIIAEDLSDSGSSFLGINPEAPGDLGTLNDATSLLCSLSNVSIATPNQVCPDKSFHLSALSDIDEVDYVWSAVGDTILSNDVSFTISGITSTTTYQLKAINKGETCFYHMEAELEIEALEPPTVEPEAMITLSSDCAPSTINFTTNPTEGDTSVLSYIWSGGGYSWVSIEEDPSISNAHAFYNGSYTVIATDANGCTGTGVVEVVGASLSGEGDGLISLNNSALDCNNLITGGFTISATNYNSATDPVVYHWATPGGVTTNISGLGTHEITIDPIDLSIHQGLYFVEISAGDCALASDTLELQIFDQIGAPEIFIESTYGLCEGGSFKLFANILNASAYEWIGPNGYSSSNENPIISNVGTAANGLYTLTAFSDEGCTITASIEVTEITDIPPTPAIAGNDLICEDETIILNPSEVYSTSTSYEWTNAMGVVVGNTAELNISSTDSNALSPFQLKIINNGCPSELSTAFEVQTMSNPNLNVSISNENVACVGEAVQLTAASISGATYEWRQAGSLIILSTEQNPVFTPENELTTYELSVFYPDCSVTLTESIDVEIYPTLETTASIDFDLNGNCQPSDLFFSNEIISGNDNITNYEWTGPHGFNSNESNPVITNANVSNNGNYTLVITNENGCTAISNFQFNNDFNAVAEPVISSNVGDVCEGGFVQLSVPEYIGDNVVYNWSIPASANGNVSGVNTNSITIDVSEAAIHNGAYALTVEVDGCTLVASDFDLIITEVPVISPAIFNDAMICEGGSITLEANATGANSFQWSGPNGFTSTEENPTLNDVSVFQNGVYVLTVNTDEGCFGVSSLLVNQIGINPISPSINGVSELCAEEMIVLSANETFSGQAVYQWTNDLGVIVGNMAELNIDPEDPNAISPYQLEVFIAGCSSGSSNAFEVTTIVVPDVVLEIAGSDQICNGDPVSLTATNVPGGIYEWSVQGNSTVISTEPNPTFFPETGNTTYVLGFTDPLCSTFLSYSIDVEMEQALEVNALANYNLDSNCVPSGISFSSEILSGTGGLISYEWSGPNNFSDSNPNPIFTDVSESNNGNYTLVVTNENGCTATSSFELANDFESVAHPIITTDSPGACEGSPIVLYVPEYIGSNVVYNWTIPSSAENEVSGLNTNGLNISALENNIHTGNYSLSIEVDGCVLTSQNFELEVNEVPTINPSINNTANICEGASLLLEANATGVNSFLWTGPNGFSSMEENPEISNTTILNNGTYTLHALGTGACEVEEILIINNINELPVEPQVFSSVMAVCEGSGFNLELANTYAPGSVSYQWTNANGITIGTDPTLNLTAGMSEVVPPFSLMVSNGNCSTTTSLPFDLDIIENPEVTINAVDPVCAGSDIQIFTSSVSNATYEWRIAGTSTIVSNEQSPLFLNVEENTSFELTYSTGSCNWEPIVTEVVVYENPAPNLVPSYTLNPDCSPADLMLSVNLNTGAGNNLNYEWTGPDNFISNEQNPVIQNASSLNNGMYTLIVSNENTCLGSATAEVNSIVDAPDPDVPVIEVISSLCNDSEIVLSVTTYNGGTVNYNWTIPSELNVSGLNTNEISIQNVDPSIHNGTYEVTIEVDDCVLTSSQFSLETAAAPSVDVSINNQGVICEGGSLEFDVSSSGAVSYEWEGPNGFSSNESTLVIDGASVLNNGIYTLVVYNAEGCSATETIEVDNIATQPVTPILNGNNEICDNENIEINVLQNYVGNDVVYQWYNGLGDLVSEENTLSISANDPLAISPFYASVSVAGCISESSELMEMNVNSLPVPIVSSDSPTCFGQAVTLSGSSQPGASYFWYVGDPSGSSPPAVLVSTEQNYTINNLQVGAYDYYLVVENENGCQSENAALTSVEITAQPMLSSIFGEGEYCDGATVELAVVAVTPYGGSANFEWNGPNGFQYTGFTLNGEYFSLTLPNFDPSMAGVYTLDVELENTCIVNQVSALIQVNETPELPVLSANENNLCEGQSLILNATSYTGSTLYEWFFTSGNGTISLGTTVFPSLIIDDADESNSGVYSVSVAVGDCVSGFSNSETVEIFGGIVSPVIENITSDQEPACEFETLSLSVPIVQNATYYWYGPNGFIVEGNTLVFSEITSADAGNYYVVMEVDGCASVVSDETMVFVNATPATPVLIDGGPICEGGDISLLIDGPIILPPGVSPVFEWYFQNTNNSIGTTMTPELTIPNASGFNNGQYFVSIISGNCVSSFSNAVLIEVGAIPNEFAEAGEDQNLCSENSISLNATTPPTTTGFWYSPTGGSIADISDPNALVSDLTVGENLFVWSLFVNGCDPFDADTVVINISNTDPVIAFAGDDISLCDETILSLNAPDPIGAPGEWSQPIAQTQAGIILEDATAPDTEVIGLEAGNTYTFYWTVYDSFCGQYSEDEVQVTISETPDNNALVPMGVIYSCDSEAATIAAISPDIGGGVWTTNSLEASISNPESAVVLVGDLPYGETEFIWSISYGACLNYDADTLVLINERDPIANPENYTTGFRETLMDRDLLANDDLGNIGSWSVALIEAPAYGSLSDNISEGIMDYTPNDGFVGTDVFVYELCNVNCPSACDTTMVTIQVSVGEEEKDCWVPDVITPNNDGYNDCLKIPCLVHYPENDISIYNRWGDKVFETEAYQNDWGGTYKNAELPPGTYYFFLKLNEDSPVIQGYITLVR